MMIKKKLVLPISILLYSFVLLMLGLLAADIYFVVLVLQSVKTLSAFEWIGVICSLICFVGIIFLLIKLTRIRIILDVKEIYVPGYGGNEKNRMQFKTRLDYRMISNIFLINSNKNSRNKTVEGSFIMMPYLIFELYSGSKEAINMACFSKKQVVKIIDDILLRTKALGNELSIGTGTQILKEFLEKEKSRSKKTNRNKD